MPSKNELLHKESSLRKYNKIRTGFRREIIKALPDSLDITRVHVSDNHMKARSSSQGVVELTLPTFNDALRLREMPGMTPLPTVKVAMERPQQGFVPTISFYPEMLVVDEWVEQHKVTPIYPVIFHMIPIPGGAERAAVYLEWFIFVRQGLIANVRVFIENHPCAFRLTNGRIGLKTWEAAWYPRGNTRILSTTYTSRPFVSVYWDRTCFNDEFTLADLLAESRVQADV